MADFIALTSLPAGAGQRPAAPGSPSSLLARRNAALPSLALPPPFVSPPLATASGLVPERVSALRRPGAQPLQGVNRGSSERSSRNVHFDHMPAMASVIARPSPAFSGSPLLGDFGVPARRPATLFGRPTRFRPLWLLAMGNAGSCLFGSGEVVLQRAIWPAKTYRGLNPNGPTALPGGTAGHGTTFGGELGGIVGGSVLMAVGVGLALTACSLFVRDGRALNRRQNPAKPNYSRTMGYFYAHLCGIGLLVGHRFAVEAFRIYLEPRWQWVAALPGAVGQAVLR